MTNHTPDQFLAQFPTLKFIGEFSISMERYLKFPTPENLGKAMYDFAVIDWIEPEIDSESDPMTNAIMEMVYRMGKSKGFKILDEMSEEEMEFLGLN